MSSYGQPLHSVDDMQWDVKAAVSFFNKCSLVWSKWTGYWPNGIQIIYIATTHMHPRSSRLQNSFIRSRRVSRIFTESWMKPQAMPSTKYAYPMHPGNKTSVILIFRRVWYSGMYKCSAYQLRNPLQPADPHKQGILSSLSHSLSNL